jgi:excisionase family DNA binding protein
MTLHKQTGNNGIIPTLAVDQKERRFHNALRGGQKPKKSAGDRGPENLEVSRIEQHPRRCCMDDDTHGGVITQELPVTFLTPIDLQRELQIGEKLAYRLLKSGKIPSVRIGGLYRISRRQLEEALLEDPELSNKRGRATNSPQRKPPTKEVLDDSTR